MDRPTDWHCHLKSHATSMADRSTVLQKLTYSSGWLHHVNTIKRKTTSLYVSTIRRKTTSLYPIRNFGFLWPDNSACSGEQLRGFLMLQPQQAALCLLSGLAWFSCRHCDCLQRDRCTAKRHLSDTVAAGETQIDFQQVSTMSGRGEAPLPWLLLISGVSAGEYFMLLLAWQHLTEGSAHICKEQFSVIIYRVVYVPALNEGSAGFYIKATLLDIYINRPITGSRLYFPNRPCNTLLCLLERSLSSLQCEIMLGHLLWLLPSSVPVIMGSR